MAAVSVRYIVNEVMSHLWTKGLPKFDPCSPPPNWIRGASRGRPWLKGRERNKKAPP
jgi:hypothetical protein